MNQRSSIKRSCGHEQKKKEVEADLEMAIRKGKSCGMTDQELLELFQIVLED